MQKIIAEILVRTCALWEVYLLEMIGHFSPNNSISTWIFFFKKDFDQSSGCAG